MRPNASACSFEYRASSRVRKLRLPGMGAMSWCARNCPSLLRSHDQIFCSGGQRPRRLRAAAFAGATGDAGDGARGRAHVVVPRVLDDCAAVAADRQAAVGHAARARGPITARGISWLSWLFLGLESAVARVLGAEESAVGQQVDALARDEGAASVVVRV